MGCGHQNTLQFGVGYGCLGGWGGVRLAVMIRAVKEISNDGRDDTSDEVLVYGGGLCVGVGVGLWGGAGAKRVGKDR
ncbi:hypothetical protein L6R29_02370 [Myxococcota bacterium]|nr:hypothetical protein [Myxococcota bacterium]